MVRWLKLVRQTTDADAGSLAVRAAGLLTSESPLLRTMGIRCCVMSAELKTDPTVDSLLKWLVDQEWAYPDPAGNEFWRLVDIEVGHS